MNIPLPPGFTAQATSPSQQLANLEVLYAHEDQLARTEAQMQMLIDDLPGKTSDIEKATDQFLWAILGVVVVLTFLLGGPFRELAVLAVLILADMMEPRIRPRVEQRKRLKALRRRGIEAAKLAPIEQEVNALRSATGTMHQLAAPYDILPGAFRTPQYANTLRQLIDGQLAYTILQAVNAEVLSSPESRPAADVSQLYRNAQALERRVAEENEWVAVEPSVA